MMVLTQPNEITLTAEQVLKEDGTVKKAIVIDAFVNPDNLLEKIITVEFYYGMTAETDEQDNTVYRGYSNREKLTVETPMTAEAVQTEIQSLWNEKYSLLNTGLDEIESLKDFVL
jgi:hypothetical protein